MSHKIFFDTNILSSPESVEHFFGGRDQLSRFQRVSEILIPSIVNTEIKNQKRRHLISKRDSFKINPFFRKIGIQEIDISDEKIEKWIEKIESEEKIQYTRVPLKNKDVLASIVDLAIVNQAPFEVNSDKGFKDTLIYFTILQYAEDNPSDQIYFISNDGRLCEALKKHKNIKVFKDYDDYEKHQKTYFLSDYFIEKLKEATCDTSIDIESLKEIKLDKELNWIISIKTKVTFHEVVVDYLSKEIISYF